MTKKPIKLIDEKLGLLKIFSLENINEIKKETITLCDEVLIPGLKTTLKDFFSKEVEYLGTHDNYLQFKVGENYDLFGREFWCNEFKKIDENRMVTVFQAGTARDFNFKNGVWK